MARPNKTIARLAGNFGVSFFAPLVGANVAESIYDTGLSFTETLIISAIAAAFTVGLACSRELVAYGEKREAGR